MGTTNIPTGTRSSGPSLSLMDTSLSTSLTADGLVTNISLASAAGVVTATFDQVSTTGARSRSLSTCAYRAYSLPQTLTAGGVYRLVMTDLSVDNTMWIGMGLMSSSGPGTFAAGGRLSEVTSGNIAAYLLDGTASTNFNAGSASTARMTLTFAVSADGTLQEMIATAEQADGTVVDQTTLAVNQALSGLLWFVAFGTQDTTGSPSQATAEAKIACYAVDDPT